MNKIILLTLFLFICPDLFGQFRSSKWGQSKSQIKEQESLVIKHEGESGHVNYIIYSSSVGGLDAYIYYIFASDSLVRAKYIFDEEHSSDNLFITDFNNVDKTLENKYSNPIDEDYIWSNDLYKDDSSQYGFAVSLGHLFIYTKWETDDTTIFHSLSGDNYEVTHQIEYSSTKLNAVEERAKAKKALSDF